MRKQRNNKRIAKFAMVVIAFFAICEVRSFANTANEILKETGIKGGLIVHLGCGDGKLTSALYANKSYLVHGLDSNSANIAKAREYIKEKGIYGKVSVEHWDKNFLPYTDNLVNLIISEDIGEISNDEIMRVLAPYGVAYIKTNGKWNKTIKPYPKEMDEWTHWLYGPDNNAVSKDEKVGVSRNLQWIMHPIWGRHHNLIPSFSTMVSAGGRIYYIIDKAPIGVKCLTDKWVLGCRDAFNGILLWERTIDNWRANQGIGKGMRFQSPDQILRHLVAINDNVYVTLGFKEPLIVLDGKTGKKIKEYKETENASVIMIKDNVIFLTKDSKEILAIDIKTGELLWEKKGYTGIGKDKFANTYLTIGKNNLFFLNGDSIIALEMKTGKEIWQSSRPEIDKSLGGKFANLCTLVYSENILLLGQLYPSKKKPSAWQEKDMIIVAFNANSGGEFGNIQVLH